MFLSQKCFAASMPRMPLPSGFVGPTPMGSSMQMSGASSASQLSRSLAWT